MKYCMQNANRSIDHHGWCWMLDENKQNKSIAKFTFVSSINAFHASILAIVSFLCLNGVACNQLIAVGRYLNIIEIHWSNLFHIIAHQMVQKKTTIIKCALPPISISLSLFPCFNVRRPIPRTNFTNCIAKLPNATLTTIHFIGIIS